ncbi:unnamed protein product [Candidula unifasciata]|uniref:CUB domain-containing protein n=1 Tax=Candidula unifasciata TaxID=100452 RepID=A0A8S3YVP5_9EUPU|nr:unnamed protein product [Candidula unifasciata]
MEAAEQLWLLFVFSFIMDTVGQSCTEFSSPMLIDTSSTKVGTIKMPDTGGRKYQSNQVCQWIIETEVGYCIQLDVTKCTLEGRDIYGDCNNDYVDVFDSTDDRDIFIGRFCDRDQGKSFKTASSKMIVRFVSNQNFEYSGFEASYQSVVPEDSDNENGETKMLGMAIGISVGVFALLMAALTIVLIVRYRRKKAATRNNTQPADANQNNYHPDMGLPGGNLSSDPSHCADRYGIYVHLHVDGSSEVDPHSRNVLSQSVIPSNFHDDPRNFRSVTPPPAYDSLDYVNAGYNRMSLSPPPYEAVVKYCKESSSA